MATDDELVDEADIAGALLTGDLSGREVSDVHLGSDLMLPAALAVFGALGVRVDDEQ